MILGAADRVVSMVRLLWFISLVGPRLCAISVQISMVSIVWGGKFVLTCLFSMCIFVFSVFILISPSCFLFILCCFYSEAVNQDALVKRWFSAPWKRHHLLHNYTRSNMLTHLCGLCWNKRSQLADFKKLLSAVMLWLSDSLHSHRVTFRKEMRLRLAIESLVACAIECWGTLNHQRGTRSIVMKEIEPPKVWLQ